MKFKLHNEKLIHDKFFNIKEATLDYDHYDGSQSHEVVRFAVDKGPAVACMIYLYDIEKYVLVQQFRYPVTLLPNEDPWILEVVAGVIDVGHNAEQTAWKEIQEEAGFVPDSLELIYEMWTSPGISSERIFIYLAKGRSTQSTQTGDPNDTDEDVKVHYFSKKELRQLLLDNKVKDAKTIIAIQHVLLS